MVNTRKHGIPGRLPPKYHPKTLLLSKYLDMASLPTPPEKVYLEYKTPASAKQMFGNDVYGDCTCAAQANFLIDATCHSGTAIVPTLAEVLAVYSGVTGFSVGPPVLNDNGAAMTDVLAYMQSTGLAGHKILAWAQIDYTNALLRKLGIYLFGATYTGVNLPQSAMDQFDADQPWEVSGDGTIVGGHAILRTGYGSEGSNYVTWANWEQKASNAWDAAYVEEEYVIITQDWLNAQSGKSVFGFDLASLQADIAQM
jgi:hypothetical protein